MKTLRSIALPAIIMMMAFISIPAQSGGTFTITKSVIAGGGGTSNGGTFILDGTIGQPFGGTQSSGGVFSLTSGYWSPAAAPSPTPGGASISGTVSYAIVTKPVPGTTLNAAGSPNVMALTAADGTYQLSNLGAGAYTVTPSRPTQLCSTSNGIFANDASFVSQFVVGSRVFTANQQAAARVSGLGFISSFDASLIARKVVGICTHLAGVWQFMPVNKAYPEVLINLSGENYTAIMIGDVSGDWNPLGPNRPATFTEDPDAVRVSVPTTTAGSGSMVTVPLRIDRLKGMGLTSYQFDIEYDPTILEPAKIAAELSGAVGERLSIVSNVPEPGLLKVAVYGAYPATGDGVYADLKFTVIGSVGTATPLTIRQFIYNDGMAGVLAVNGGVKVTHPETLIRGRLVTAAGEPVDNAQVVLTSTTGARRQMAASALGNFEFSSLELGQTYTLTVRTKHHAFAPVTVSVTRNVTEVELIAIQQ